VGEINFFGVGNKATYRHFATFVQSSPVKRGKARAVAAARGLAALSSDRGAALADHPDIAAQRILRGAYVNESARDVLTKLEGNTAGMRKAAEFLGDALENGPRMAAEVISEGEAAGLGKRALQRALRALGGWSEKPSFGTGWIWELPKRAS
jgi:hypothetical protein